MIAFVSYTVKAQIHGATLRAMNDIIVPISHLTIFAVQILHGELFSDQKRLYSLSDTRYEASRRITQTIYFLWPLNSSPRVESVLRYCQMWYRHFECSTWLTCILKSEVWSASSVFSMYLMTSSTVQVLAGEVEQTWGGLSSVMNNDDAVNNGQQGSLPTAVRKWLGMFGRLMLTDFLDT